MSSFEKLGKELLRHKYLYYEKGEPEVLDCDYDQLELDYVLKASKLEKEPNDHLIAEWDELGGLFASVVVGFPHDHPWADQIVLDNIVL